MIVYGLSTDIALIRRYLCNHFGEFGIVNHFGEFGIVSDSITKPDCSHPDSRLKMMRGKQVVVVSVPAPV